MRQAFGEVLDNPWFWFVLAIDSFLDGEHLIIVVLLSSLFFLKIWEYRDEKPPF